MEEKTNDSTNNGPTGEITLGRMLFTAKVAQTLPKVEVCAAVARHKAHDWGTVEAEDWQDNNKAAVKNAFVLSAYRTDGGVAFWVLTEGDRSVTTVLFPEEY